MIGFSMIAGALFWMWAAQNPIGVALLLILGAAGCGLFNSLRAIYHPLQDLAE